MTSKNTAKQTKQAIFPDGDAEANNGAQIMPGMTTWSISRVKNALG
jgi:hypothetical protein